MRGLPPQPVDVIQIRQDFDINGHVCSIGFSWFDGSWAGAGELDADRAVNDWLTYCLPTLLGLMHSSCIPTTCRFVQPGNAYVAAAPPAHGAWTGGQADNVALGLALHTGLTGRGRTHIVYVPGVPDAFIDGNWRISQLGWGNLVAASRDLFLALHQIRTPLLTNSAPGVLQRSRMGVPLTTAQFAPLFSVIPTPKVVTIRRRIPRTRSISSS